VLASNLTAPVGRIVNAFELAGRACVEDLGARKAELAKQLSSRLSGAVSALRAARTAQTLEGLGEAVHFGQKLKQNRTELEAAARVYEAELQSCLVAADVDCVANAVEFAVFAQARVPKQAEGWRVAAKMLADVSRLPSGTASEYDAVMRAVSLARAGGLPENATRLPAVRARAQALTASRIDRALAANDTDSALLALTTAAEAGIPETQLAGVRGKVQASIAAELSAASVVELATTRDAANIVTAADKARRVGLPAATIAAARAEAEARYGKRLTAAREALAASKGVSPKALESFALLADLGRKLAHNKTQMALAARTFEAVLPQEGAATAGDMPLIEAAVSLRDMVRAQLPQRFIQWFVLAQRIRTALPTASSDKSAPEVRSIIEAANGAAMPDTDELVVLKERARANAAFRLVTTVSGSGAASMASAVDVAVRAGVSETKLATASAVTEAFFV